MSSSRRRAQTAVEAMFIIAVILTGVALIVPSYLRSSTVSTMDVYVRDAASSACDYLNEGVFVIDSMHQPLNVVLTYTNGSYAFFSFKGINVVENGGEVGVTVYIGTGVSFTPTQLSVVEDKIKEYILRYISSRPNVRREGDYLYMGEKRFTITVNVGDNL